MKINKIFLKGFIKVKCNLLYRWNILVFAEIILMFTILHLEQRQSLVISFISILIHEFSHIVLAMMKGSKFNNFQMHIYGARVDLLDVDELNYKEKLLIYIAGPLANICIVFIFMLINYYVRIEIYESIVTINIGLAIFNLLPAYPLDGARILEIILSRKMLYKEAQLRIAWISYFIGGAFIVIYLYGVYKYRSINITMLLVAIIIIYITRTEKKAVMYILMGNIYKKVRKLIRNNYLENRVISVYYKLGLVDLMKIVDKNRFNIFYVLDDDLKVKFIIAEDELIEGLKIYGNITLEEYYGKKEKFSN